MAACRVVAVDVGAQGLTQCSLARHRAPQGQRLVASARSEGDPVGDGRRLQLPEGAGFVRVRVDVSRVGRPSSWTKTPRRLSNFFSRMIRFCNSASSASSVGALTSTNAIGAAPVHAVQQQAVQMNVEVDRRAEALDQRHGAAVSFASLELGVAQHIAREHALQHLQHRCDQLGLRGQRQAQPYRQRQDSLPHWHLRDHRVDQVAAVCDMCHASHDGQNPWRLQLKVSSLSWPHSPHRNIRKPYARMPVATRRAS